MDIDTLIGIAGIIAAGLLLLVVTATESILIYLSRGRARSLASRGGPRAEALQRYIHERTHLLSTLHFGRTLALTAGTAFAIHVVTAHNGAGWQPVLAAAGGALVVAALIGSVPDVIGARNPEHWGLILSPLIRILGLIFLVPSLALRAPAVLIARRTPLPASPPEDEEQELLRLVEMEESSGGMEEEERQMIRGVIDLVDTTAREIMVPRIDMAAVSADASLVDVERMIVERGFSRIPLYDGSIDNIVGIIYAKDVLRHLAEGTVPASLTELARRVYFIPETKKLGQLLTELRQEKIHIAIVVDEYGGTAGLVTTEDIIEEIVGEIEDEYDTTKEVPDIEVVSENEALVDARVGIDALNDLFDADLANDEYDTAGGILYTHLGRVPQPGDVVDIDGLHFEVLTVTGRRIRRVRVTRAVPVASAEQDRAAHAGPAA